MGGVDQSSGQIQQPGGAQLGEQPLVQLLPDTGLVPLEHFTVLLRTMNDWLREMGLQQRVRVEERPEQERVVLHVPGSGSSHAAVYSHPAEPTAPQEWQRLLASFTQGIDAQFGPQMTSPAKPYKGNAGEVGPLDRAFARTVAASLGHLLAMRLERVAEVAFRMEWPDSGESSS